MVNKKSALVFGMPVLAAVLAGIVFAYNFLPTSGGLGSWRDFRDGASLVENSERIVLATYLSESTYERPTVTTNDGKVIGSVTEIFRKFRVDESLKGDASVGDTQYMVFTKSVKTARDDGGSDRLEYDQVSLDSGEQYVLFLINRGALEEYPSEYGDTLWVRPGEPGIAQMDSNGRLTFIATDRYKETIEEEGLERASSSDAPFELTKDGITGSSSAR